MKGSLHIQGSKNAALPMMAAAVLHHGICVLHHCPKIADVLCMENILKSLGARTSWEGNTLSMDCSGVCQSRVDKVYADKMRSSIILLGAVVARIGEGCIAHPGGCVIGARPIDMHLQVLQMLGTVIQEREGMLNAVCHHLKGGEMTFPKQSVGATEQGIIAAVLAEGITQLHNCAREPEIYWLARFLNSMGARISGAGGDTVVIRGVANLHDTEFTVPADRIVAGTYICGAAITRGEILVENPPIEELGAFLDVYSKMGGQYELIGGKLYADGRRVNRAVPSLLTGVYPGFPTDLQSPVMAVLATVDGESSITETIFEDRYKAAGELSHMGAQIAVEGRRARIVGVPKLQGCQVRAQELRGGAALVLAGLAAEGETCIRGSGFIHRGYEHICSDMASLGGIISEDTGKNYYENIKLP